MKSFTESPFSQRIIMLSYDIVRKNSMLTDKLLRLLSLISIVLADDKYTNNLSKPVTWEMLTEQPDVSEKLTLIIRR
jgi:hypothetical protein